MSLRVINRGDSNGLPEVESPPRSASADPATETIVSHALSRRGRSGTDPSFQGREIVVIGGEAALPEEVEKFLALRHAQAGRIEAVRKFNQLTCMMAAIIVTAFFGVGYLLLNSKKV
jgi:hypothetical protein